MWKCNYSTLPYLSNVNKFTNRIPTSMINNAINQLNICFGFDGIHSYHLKNSSSIMKFIFTQFFNFCFIHNHFPEKLLAGVIRPCVNNRSGDFKSSSNYREVMISSNFMKVLEYIILPYNQTIPINPRQFSHRKNTSTILTTMISKETVKQYIDQLSSVFTCFLELSKVFERIEYSILIDRLRKKHVHEFIINILCSKVRPEFISMLVPRKAGH